MGFEAINGVKLPIATGFLICVVLFVFITIIGVISKKRDLERKLSKAVSIIGLALFALFFLIKYVGF
ncbi:hypothetical protein [Brevibacillus brevis]|uniref:hypothetical protein n=1 Tax=Brevibacillus brevis TaxID=1393 RepID=UPI0037C809DD